MALSSYSELWERLTNKGSYREISGFDLFYQLTYMSAVAAAGISRSRIFKLSAELPRLPAEFFAKAHLLAQKLGYDYSRACTMVGFSVHSEAMKSLLLRFANALTSGQPEAQFLAEEAQLQGQTYEKEYERDLTSLTKWTDAYAALNISAALIVIVNLTSTLIYRVSNTMIISLVITAVATNAIGAWILAKASPQETRDLFSVEGSSSQKMVFRLVGILPLTAVVVVTLLLLIRINFGMTLIVGGIILFPLGWFAEKASREVERKDKEIGPFMRSLGGMAVATGTTTTEALTRLDLSSYPNLEPELERLHWRLRASISPELSWHKFAQETGSQMVGEIVEIYTNAVNLGGDPDIVALLAAEFATKTVMLRAKRKVVASTFTWLTIAMHGAVAALMIFILEIIVNFALLLNQQTILEGVNLANTLALSMTQFTPGQLQMFRWLTVGIVLLLAVVNAVAILVTDGGQKYKIFFYLSILLFLSGLSLMVVPPIVLRVL